MPNEDKKNKEKDGIGKTLFIVDDDNFLLDMYVTKFKEYGFTVIASLGTVDALAKIEGDTAIDVLISDIVMPVMSGFEFLEEVKKRGLAKKAIIIILSNLGQKQDIEKGVALGAKGYIVKATSTPREVVDKVLEIMKNNDKK